MNHELIPFDMSDLLDSEEAISEYLTQVFADGDSDEILRAIGHIARARGMANIAQETGLGRESLYKTFGPGAKPRFETVIKVIRALGIDLLAQPHATPSRSN
ncbi:putative addiction module antidote protein [Pseudomonas hunanensis]|uniref:Addiction module antidote protein n=1 Tax=Pseudomonas hunanensis TaxID=1247546 RepID=A0ACC6K6E2_9PSED|nr:addiction module antidote protein [Pseudomonas hunanensis]MDR6714060.1 putative addiction module antidote protein [Pseudomonas hunanensis]